MKVVLALVYINLTHYYRYVIYLLVYNLYRYCSLFSNLLALALLLIAARSKLLCYITVHL
jgi:hypothetical protein